MAVTTLHHTSKPILVDYYSICMQIFFLIITLSMFLCLELGLEKERKILFLLYKI